MHLTLKQVCCVYICHTSKFEVHIVVLLSVLHNSAGSGGSGQFIPKCELKGMVEFTKFPHMKLDF